MAEPLPGRRLNQMDFVPDAIGAEVYGNKDGLPWRVPAGVPGGLATLTPDGDVPPEQLAFKAALPGAVKRALAEKLSDIVSPNDAGAAGDGVTDDTAAFATLEASITGTVVDLGGRTFLVDDIPTGNEYVNGFFKRGGAIHYGRPVIDRSYRKRVVHNIDRWNEHQQWAIDTYSYAYIAVQGFTVDEEAGELWLVHNGEGGNEWTWIEVRDWQTGEFIRYFSAGTKLTDSIVLYYDGSTRYMLCKEGVGVLGKYDVTTLPANRARIEAVSTHDIGFQSQIFLHDDVLYAASNSDTNPVGVKYHRTVYKKFDLDFNFLGYIEVARNTGGHSNDAYELANLPKRQGFAVGPGFFVTSHGYIAGSIPYSGPVAANNGVVVMDVNGKPTRQSLCEPNAMAAVLTAAGFTVTRLENEGVWVSRDGTVYTLLTTLTNIGLGEGDGGTLIMEEFSDAPDALDFAAAAVVPLAQDIPAVDFPLRMSGQAFPVDRVTGTALDTIDKMLDYMVNNDTRELKFFTTSFPGVKDYAAVDLPTNTWVALTSYDNFRFRVELIGFNYTKSYTVVGQSGARAVSTGNETDTGWQAPTLLNSWVNYAGTRSNAGYRRIGNRVHLRGVLKDGSTVNSDDVFTLPSGFRPTASIDLPIITGTAGNAAIAIRITSGGTVRFYGTVNNAFVSLDGISFLVD